MFPKRFIAGALLGAVCCSMSICCYANSHKGTSHLHIKRPRPYEAIIAKYARAYHVPVNLAHAVIRTESNYNPQAHGKAGEIGLMQLMPATARSLGFKGPLTDLYNPIINIKYGMRYLSKAHKLGRGNICRTILKYNAGYGAHHMNNISYRYCKKVKKYLSRTRYIKFVI